MILARIAAAHTGPRLVTVVLGFSAALAVLELGIRAARVWMRKHRDPYRTLAERDRERSRR